MSKRKTYPVSKLKETAHIILSQTHLSRDEKSVVCSFLEKVLHETGNYNGFMFVFSEEEGIPHVDDEHYYNRKYF